MPWRANSQWGAHLWGFIHTITIIDFDEPAIQQNVVKQTMEHLRAIAAMIPCKYCAQHYRDFIDGLSEEDAMKPMRLFEHMVAFHNEVNRKLNKPEFTLQQALEQWAKRV